MAQHLSHLTGSLDLNPGYRNTLSDIQSLIADDDDGKNLTKEQREELIAELVEFRKQKQVGARTSNGAAAQDMRQTMVRINDEVSFLPAYAPLPIH